MTEEYILNAARILNESAARVGNEYGDNWMMTSTGWTVNPAWMRGTTGPTADPSAPAFAKPLAPLGDWLKEVDEILVDSPSVNRASET